MRVLGALTVACVAFSSLGDAFVTPAASTPSQARRQGHVMMARRQYAKKITRLDFLLRSSLITAVAIPAYKIAKKDDASNDVALRFELNEEENDGVSSSAAVKGVPFRFSKSKDEALNDLREVVDSIGATMTSMPTSNKRKKGTNDWLKIDFAGEEELEIQMKNDGIVTKPVPKRQAVHDLLGAWKKTGCEDMKKVNLLASKLALRGGWHTTGYPLTCNEQA